MRLIKTFSFIILLTTSLLVNSQEEYRRSLEEITQVQINSRSSIKISVGDTDILIIKEYAPSYKSIKKRKNQKEKAKGLSVIYGEDGDSTNGLGINIIKEGNVLKIKELNTFERGGLLIVLPAHMKLKINAGYSGKIEISDFISEIEATTNFGSMIFKNVNGPIVVNSSSGNINVEFAKLNQENPISIYSCEGDLDISLPSKTKANLEMLTSIGLIYSNVPLNLKEDSKKAKTGFMNKGGVRIIMRSCSGNIYLRKIE